MEAKLSASNPIDTYQRTLDEIEKNYAKGEKLITIKLGMSTTFTMEVPTMYIKKVNDKEVKELTYLWKEIDRANLLNMLQGKISNIPKDDIDILAILFAEGIRFDDIRASINSFLSSGKKSYNPKDYKGIITNWAKQCKMIANKAINKCRQSGILPSFNEDEFTCEAQKQRLLAMLNQNYKYLLECVPKNKFKNYQKQGKVWPTITTLQEIDSNFVLTDVEFDKNPQYKDYIKKSKSQSILCLSENRLKIEFMTEIFDASVPRLWVEQKEPRYIRIKSEVSEEYPKLDSGKKEKIPEETKTE